MDVPTHSPSSTYHMISHSRLCNPHAPIEQSTTIIDSRFPHTSFPNPQGLYKQMVEIFKSLGVEAVPGVGTPFDPSIHDAIMRQANNDVPEGTVLQEFRKGFRLGEKLLRPAMVQVSQKPPWVVEQLLHQIDIGC